MARRERTMAEMWTGFITHVYPELSPTSTQYIELQRTFYSGAFALFGWFMTQLDENTEPTEEDMNAVSTIHNEMISYFASLLPPGTPSPFRPR